jgi:crossover junction endodeoxyribonuclease RuvC
MVVLGIDPGLRVTGFGVLEDGGGPPRLIAAGDVRLPVREPLPARLAFLRGELTRLIRRHRPAVMVLETVFTHHDHPATAARMAHARGIACLLAQEEGLALAELPPARVKKALTGVGGASKTQVARMVAQWLGRPALAVSADATDALALALTHIHMATSPLAAA